MKDYLGYENARNKQHAALYERLIKLALKRTDVSVLIGHHLTFEIGGDLATENEIPSADCLLFDHDFMHAVFGDDYQAILVKLALHDCDQREAIVEKALAQLTLGEPIEV